MAYLGLEPLEPLGLPTLRSAGLRRKKQQAEGEAPLSPEEETGLLSGTLGMLGWLAESFDKPRAAVQGLLAGKPEQLLNLVPFSDTIGLTSETGYLAPYINQLKHDDRVYGRDLLEAWNVAPPNQEGFHPVDNPQDALWDALGLTTEIVGDPLNLVKGPMGALTSAGLGVSKGAKFAKGAEGLTDLVTHAGKVADETQMMGKILGSTPQAVADEIRRGERGLISLGLPFVKEPWKVFGAGSERAAKLVEAVNYSKFSPVVPLRAAFSKKVGGILDPVQQAARDKSFSKLINEDAMLRVAAETFQDRLPQLEALWKDIGGQTGYEGADEMVRTIAEMRNFADGTIPVARQEIVKLFDKTGPEVDQFAEQVEPLVAAFMKIKDVAYAKHQELGGRGEWLDSMFSNHMPRGIDKKYEGEFAKVMRQYLLPTGTPNASRRNPIFDMPGGTHTVNLMSRDERLGASGSRVATELKDDLRGVMKEVDPLGSQEFLYEDMPVEQLQQWYAYHKYLAPELEKLAARGMDPAELAVKKERLMSGLVSSVPGTTPLGVKGKVAGMVEAAATPWAMTKEQFTDEYWFHGRTPSHPQFSSDIIGGGITRDINTARAFAGQAYGEFGGKVGLLKTSELPPSAVEELNKDPATRLIVGLGTTPGKAEQWIPADVTNPHRYLVEKALSEGKPVPQAVLAEYPDLAQATPFRAPLPSEAAKAAAPRAAKSAFDQAAEQPLIPQLVEYLSKLPEEVRETGLFNRTMFQSWMDYNEHLAVSVANLSTIHNFLGSVISKEPKGDDWVSLKQAWNGVVSPKGERRLTDDGLTYAVKRHMMKEDPEALNAVDPKHLLGYNDELGNPVPGWADELWVDPKTAETIGKYMEIQTKPASSLWGKAYNGYTGAMKFGLTLPWPAFHLRNWVDGTWRNYMRTSPRTYSLAELTASEARFAKVGLGAGGLEELPHWREFVNSDVLEGQNISEVAATMGLTGGEAPATLLQAVTEPLRPRYWEQTDKWDWLNPLNTRGIRKAEKTSKQNVLAEMGSRTHQYVELHNRYVPFAAAMDHGLDAAQARKLVLDIQYDYSRLKGGALQGNFGDTVARKVFPFWSFMQNNVPYQLGQLFNAPGGGHAQTLRFINQMHRSNKEYLPEWLSERTAIRIPGDDDEKAKFVRQFGLSIEDLTRFSPHFTGQAAKRTASRFLAEMNPALTLPVKLFMQEDLYSGRPLKEMKGPTGIPVLDAAIMSTPASRGINTAEMLLDERSGLGLKALNLLSGVKVGSYDLEKAKAYDLEKANEAVIAGSPKSRSFTQIYIPKAERENVSAETLRAVERSKQLTKKIRELLDRRKKEKAGAM